MINQSVDINNEINKSILGDVKFDAYSKWMYSTDASIYQMEPLGIALPKNAEDVAEIIRICSESKTIFLPRGGGTSLAGQTVNHGIVIDFTKYMNKVISVNSEERWAIVEPGITIDELNAYLKPYGLYYTPDPTTKSRATIGGSLGNNSCGAHSVVYGKTSDQVLELDVILSNAERVHFEDIEGSKLENILDSQSNSLEKRIYSETLRLAKQHENELDLRYPKIQRRVSGYNLDFLNDGGPVNMSRMIVGSEGTLGTITAAKVKLEPIPTHVGLAVVHFADLFKSMEATVMILEHGPSAIELVDKMILDRSKESLVFANQQSFVEGDPEAILLVEYFGDDMKEVESKIDKMNLALQQKNLSYASIKALTASEQKQAWALRAAGLGLLMSVKGDSKPLPFVEDTAVSPEKLPEYVRRFDSIVRSHNTTAGYYGHASVGCLHIRPMINIKTESGLQDLVTISEEISDLVLEFNGSLSGEHGDGIVRGVWTEKMLGPTLYQAFKDVKATFDPDNILNPGKIINTPPMTENLRLSPSYESKEPITLLDFSKDGGFARAVEMCNGVGECRKHLTGTMCPSYMATREEKHSTRGRANALRSVLSGKIPTETFASKGLHDVMDLCLECKGCKAECPSNVDMAKIKYEFLYNYYKTNKMPLRSKLFSRVNSLNKVNSKIRPLYNLITSLPITKWFADIVLGIDRRRTLPKINRITFPNWFKKHTSLNIDAASQKEIVFFHDTFTDYNQVNVGIAAINILEKAGYKVSLAENSCCGRTMISKGELSKAKDSAVENINKLLPYAEKGIPIVGIEPSCILTLRDEYPELVNNEKALLVAKNTYLFDEFFSSLDLNEANITFKPDASSVLFQTHCHQKALVGSKSLESCLKFIPELSIQELDSGCCGMAGSFGFEKEHYDTSMKIGEHRLFPTIRNNPESTVITTGISCSQQINDGTGKKTIHLIEFLDAHIN